jgi:hypothetical protein
MSPPLSAWSPFGLLAEQAAPARRGGEPPPAALRSFWSAFRTAFLARNAGRVAALARVPLTVRALPDGDPVFELDRARTLAFLPAVFDEQAAAEGTPEPLMELVRRTRDLTASEDDASFAKVANLEFEYLAHRWRLSRIYSRHRP